MGIIGVLILGFGMSLIMSDFRNVLSMSDLTALVVGILTRLIPIALAYPVYNRILKRERERVAPEIMRLTEELMR